MAAAAAVAGQAIGAAGNIRQGNAAEAAGEYNAQIAEQNAQATRATAAEEERRLRVSSRKQIGQARANYGASGVQLEGSPLDVLEESAANSELDALTVRHQGEQQARSLEQYATLERFKGKNAQIAGYLGAAGNVASAAGSVGGR